MKYKFSIITVIITGLLISSLANIVQADDDYIEAKRLRDVGEILSLEEILSKVRRTYPGRILEVELEHDKGHIVYELEILGDDSIVREIYIDAKNGELLSVEEDD